MATSERRAAVRTVVVWDVLDTVLGPEPRDVLDIGGGTGVSAVRLAELGHRVTVVDPSPDALAALARRADEKGVAGRIVSHQGDLADLATHVQPASFDLVLCHGVLEVVEEPSVALDAMARVLRPGGHLSLLVAQLSAAVVARAMSGHFREALETVTDRTGRGPHRFEESEVAGLLADSDLTVVDARGVRVFADLVPGTLLDHEPGATEALIELEQEVSARPDYRALATQLHFLARR